MKFPFIRQLDSMDCGPACLGMISKYYGKEYSIDSLRTNSYLGRDGVSLLGISRAAENIGFKTVGGIISFEELANKAILPCIVHWKQEHFIVVYNIRPYKKIPFISKKNQNKGYEIFLADPSKERMSISQSEFCTNWCSINATNEDRGVVLLMEPTAQFYQQTDDKYLHKSHISFLCKYLFKYKRFFSHLILGLFLGSLLQLIFPFFTQAIVDIGINSKDIGFIWLILVAQLMLLFSRTTIDFIRRKILLHISSRINISLISDFFIKLMKLPMKFFDTKLTGDLFQRIEDHKRVEQFLTTQTLNMIFSLFSFIIFGLVLLIYNVPIFLVFLVGSILYGIWIMFFLKKRKILDYALFDKQGLNRNVIYQLINGMQEIKLQGCEQRKRWEWEDVQADLFDVNMQTLSLQQNQEAGSILINELKNILITFLAASAVISGDLTLGMMLAIQYIIGQLNTPIEQLMNFIYIYQDVNISLERMSEIHTQQNEENENRTVKNLPHNKFIKIDKLRFKYDGAKNENVLNNINLTIPQGKVTAIVGASGSGKTTLIKLILGFYSPNEGTINIGDVNLENFNLVWWRTMCGAVMQDGYLFSDTIARNIAPSDEEIDLNRLKYAAHIANIDNYIETLPLGYNTLIGQDGQGVSQGQRQRILIARAVYKNPQFIFLDEATNALDANNERAIVENLEEFYEGKTVVVVAHRLCTVSNANQIVVMNNGGIVEVGTHAELTEKKGSYYELIKNQLELGN